jgi:Predicted integral membrane protein (DUF2269)
MSWYELLLTLHIAAAALWFGSGIAITVIGYRALAADPPSFGPVAAHANWWASKAHPGSSVVILVVGILMALDADLFGEAWVWIGIGLWVALAAIGGAVIGKTSGELATGIAQGGSFTTEMRPAASRLLLASRVESAILFVAIVVMVAKPG